MFYDSDGFLAIDLQPIPTSEAAPMATETKKISTAEAMRQAVTELGSDVKNDELASYVKTTFGIELEPKYISQLKSAAKASLAKNPKSGKATKTPPLAASNGTPPPVEAPAPKDTKKVTQAEAMRQALTDLGVDAKNDALEAYIKKQFGIELESKYISQLKSAAKNKLGLKGVKTRKKATKAAAVAATNGQTPPATPPGVTPHLRHNLHDILQDMETIRQIADRVGGEGVRRILGLLGK